MIASKGGAPKHPSWYLNILVNPDVEVPVGTAKTKARARTATGVELNLAFNADAGVPAADILMDVPDKFPGYTHIGSIPATIAALTENDIAITQGPVSFGESGHVSVFARDPDRNVIELRGCDQGIVQGVTRYVP